MKPIDIPMEFTEALGVHDNNFYSSRRVCFSCSVLWYFKFISHNTL